MTMMMWKLVCDDGYLPVRFQQDDHEFGGTYIANIMLKKKQEQEPKKNWRLVLEPK